MAKLIGKTITVVALTAQTFQGRTIAAGETFDVRPVEGLALQYQRLVKLVPASLRGIPRAQPASPRRRPQGRRASGRRAAAHAEE